MSSMSSLLYVDISLDSNVNILTIKHLRYQQLHRHCYLHNIRYNNRIIEVIPVGNRIKLCMQATR